MNVILTDKDFEIFVSKAKHWIRYIGLTDWEWEFEFEKKAKKKPRKAAEVYMWGDTKPRMAKIVVYRNWGAETITEELLSKTALHEVLHVLVKKVKTNEEDAVTIMMNAINGI